MIQQEQTEVKVSELIIYNAESKIRKGWRKQHFGMGFKNKHFWQM